MKVFSFPGQGSQFVGMGEGLFEKFPTIVETANKILGYDMKELCLNDADGKLGQTRFTQPALYTVNHLYFLNYSQEADVYLGHSLGEYNALLAADAFDFSTGLKLVEKRGELMNKEKGGAMAAVLGLKREEIYSILQKNNLDSIDVANFNTPIQTVISGKETDIIDAEQKFLDSGARRYIKLAVSGAFHSRYMKQASEAFADFSKKFRFSKPKKRVIANVTAEDYQKDILDLLIKQIYSSVEWVKTIERIKTENTEFIELGPGKVLTGLYKKIS